MRSWNVANGSEEVILEGGGRTLGVQTIAAIFNLVTATPYAVEI